MTSEARRQHPVNPNDEFEKTRYHVSLDTTSNCNLKCQHCWMDAVRAQGYDFAFSVMPFDLFKNICGEFVGHCRSFGLSCGFEPLLNKNFPDYVRYAVQAGLPDVHFYTNGTLMKEAIAEELVEIGPERIVLSLEGATEETFQDVRRGARLSQFVQAIDWLAAAKKRQGKEKPVLRLNWVVMPRNMPELPQLAALARDHGIQEVYLLPHIRWKETSLQEESVIKLGLDFVANALEKFTEECEGEGITVVDEMMTALTPNLAQPKQNVLIETEETGGEAPCSLHHFDPPDVGPTIQHPYCMQPWEMMLIGCEGTIMPCTGTLLDQVYGDFRKQTLREIWESPTHVALRAGLKDRSKAGKGCLECPHFGDGRDHNLYHESRHMDADGFAATWPNVKLPREKTIAKVSG